MNPILILLVLVLVFAVLWGILHLMFRSRMQGKDYLGQDLGLDQLASMKSKLTPEEYKKIQQAVVNKVTQKLEKESKPTPERSTSPGDLLKEIQNLHQGKPSKVSGKDKHSQY